MAIPFLVYVHSPEVNLFYAGSHPMVLEYLVPFFLLGAFYLLRWWRNPVNIVLLWLLLTAGASLLLQDSASYPRFIIGFPAIAIVMAAGVYYVLPMLLARLKKPGLVRGATILLVGVISAAQVNYYFNEHLPELKTEIRLRVPFPDSTDAAIRCADMPPGTAIYMISNVMVDYSVPRTVLGLYRWNQPLPYATLRTMTPDQVTPQFLESLPFDNDLAFFIEPGHEKLVALLQSTLVLEKPQYSPQKEEIPPQRAFTLYYAYKSKQHAKTGVIRLISDQPPPQVKTQVNVYNP